MRIRFGKSSYKRLESELKTAQRLNNLRFYKITKAMLMIADEYRISTIAEILNGDIGDAHKIITLIF